MQICSRGGPRTRRSPLVRVRPSVPPVPCPLRLHRQSRDAARRLGSDPRQARHRSTPVPDGRPATSEHRTTAPDKDEIRRGTFDDEYDDFEVDDRTIPRFFVGSAVAARTTKTGRDLQGRYGNVWIRLVGQVDDGRMPFRRKKSS